MANKPTPSLAIFHRNMMALMKRDPQLGRFIQSLPETGRFEIFAEMPNVPPTVYAKELDAFYYHPANPIQDTDEQLKSLELKNTRLAVFLGMGLGYEVIRFVQKYSQAQQTSCILVVEQDPELFRLALRSVDLTSLIDNSNIRLMVGIPIEQIYPILADYLGKDSKFMLLHGLKPVYHSSSMRLNKDYYLSVLRILRDAAVQKVLYFGNDPWDSLTGLENMLDNLTEIIKNPGVNLLTNKMQGRPAVVVSTGPSLNKNKHLLKGLEDKALIICPDASLRVLLAMGVKPHLVTSLERVPATVQLLSGHDPEQVKEVYFAGCPVVRREAYEAYPGPRIIVYRNFDHFKWLGIERGILEIKQSAGNMAFKVAESLGCNPIILIGQDLSFADDGTTHAAGAHFGEREEQYHQQQTIEVLGNNGKNVKTSQTWYAFLKSYEEDVAKYQGTCINSTEGGAYIQGTQVMPFQDSIDKYIQTSFNPLTLIKTRLADFSAADAEKDLTAVRKLVDETVADVEAIIEYCREGINKHEKYKEELIGYLEAPMTIDKNLKRINEIEKQLTDPKEKARKKRRTFQLFLTHVLQSYHIKFEMEMISVPEKYDTINEACVEICLRQAEWYAVVGDLSQVCLNSLLKAKTQIDQLRIGEQDGKEGN